MKIAGKSPQKLRKTQFFVDFCRQFPLRHLARFERFRAISFTRFNHKVESKVKGFQTEGNRTDFSCVGTLLHTHPSFNCILIRNNKIRNRENWKQHTDIFFSATEFYVQRTDEFCGKYIWQPWPSLHVRNATNHPHDNTLWQHTNACIEASGFLLYHVCMHVCVLVVL